MTTHSKSMGARQWLALLVGLTTLGVTVGLMLDDVAHGAAWTVEHSFGAALLFCIPAAGLVGRWALAHGERGAGIAFIAAALLGSLLIVYLSTGRQHEGRAEAQATAVNANAARAALESERSRHDTTIADLRGELARFSGVRSAVEVKAALDAVVGDKPGKVPVAVWRRTNGCAADHISKEKSAAACEPVSALRIENGKALERETLKRRLDAAEVARASIVAKLAEAGGERVVPSKARAFAEFVGLFGLDAARVEFVASRVDLVIRTLFLEGLTVMALEYALAGIGRPSAAPVQALAPAVPAEAPKPVPPRGGKRSKRSGKPGRKGDPKVVAFAVAYKARHGRAPTGSEIKAAFPGLARSTAYDYSKRAA